MRERKWNAFCNPVYIGSLIVVCFFAFFVNNQVIPADLMEARNLATAQEMVKYGNYLHPTLNGESRLEKPPLPTWIAVAVDRIAPENLVAQRYASGLSATAMVLFLYLLVVFLTRSRHAGLVAALVLATSVNVDIMGRTATWDIYTHSFMLGAIYFMVKAFQQEGRQWNNMLLAGLLIGLSLLSKGPVSLYALLLPFLISYFVVYRPQVAGKKGPIAVMVLVALVVSCWWYVYTYFSTPDFAVQIAQKESASWLNHNVRPWYYYWKFAAEAGLWMLFWITAIVYFFINRRTVFQKEYTFAFIWFLASLFLLSIVPEKKSRYLLPLLIPGAMLTGLYLYQMMVAMRTRSEKVIFQLNVLIISLILVALPVVLYFMFYKEGLVSLFIQIVATLCSWGLCAFIVLSLFGRKGIRPVLVFGGLIAMMVMVIAIYLIPIGQMFINEERHSIRMLRENEAVAGLPFYCNEKEELRMEIVYETNQRIGKMNPEDDEAVKQALPFVFISGESIEALMSDQSVAVEYIGTFDNNWRKVNSKRYNPALVREVAIIRAK